MLHGFLISEQSEECPLLNSRCTRADDASADVASAFTLPEMDPVDTAADIMPADGAQPPIWVPTSERRDQAETTKFLQWLSATHQLEFSSYDELWQWSVDELSAYWSAVWDYFDVPGERGSAAGLAEDRMPGARWFPDARINFVEQVFRNRTADADALIYETESLGSGSINWGQLQRDVSVLAATLRRLGVEPGDRVVAVLPNVPQTILACLAAASIGAVWSVCAPETGVRGITERFGQISPKVLIACDGYRYGGRIFDRREDLARVVAELPSLRSLIRVPLLGTTADGPSVHHLSLEVLDWSEALADDVHQAPIRLPFDHPLWILYSSGTTGLPKAIVHSHGGILLTGLSSTAFHCDVRAGQRVMRLCSTAWMVWNVQLQVLLVGGTICLFEGSPTGAAGAGDWRHFWDVAAKLQVECIGAGAAYYASCMQAGVRPDDCDLSSLRTLVSTGSPLSPEAYQWIYRHVKQDLWLLSVSGGTDICAPFFAGTPALPVYVGELQCRALGTAVQAFDDDATAVVGAVGELVCTRPLPSMPLFFWGDAGNERYLESYFETYRQPGDGAVWRHGDWVKLVPRPEATGAIIYGRSDATINRNGIRMGTGEFYRVMEQLDEVRDSLVADLEHRGRPPCLLMFVVLAPGLQLDDVLRHKIAKAIRDDLSPRYVPDEIVQIDEVPTNRSGKKLEVPVKRLLLGHPLAKVVSTDTLANAHSLDWFVAFARQRNGYKD